MSELPPDPPPLAKRAAPRTVVVRDADYDRDPDEEPTGPPRVLFWLRLVCVPVALVALAVAPLALATAIDQGWGSVNPLLLLGGCVAVFVAYTLPLWWRRPRRWHWIYGLALILPGIVPLTNPLSVALLVFWCGGRTVRFFRHPPDSYTVSQPEQPTDPAAWPDPPGVLFAMRLMCVIGCGACLLAMPVVAVIHAADPDAGWGVLWWLGGFAVGFLLFAVPLFARTPRPWVWWYGLGLLVLCSLSLYFTLLAVPILAVWLTRRPRAYFAWSPPTGGGGSITTSSPAARAEFAP